MKTVFKVCGKANLKGTKISRLSFLAFVYLAESLKREAFIIQTVFAEFRLSASRSFEDALCVNVK